MNWYGVKTKAEKDARAYAAETWENPYGQAVRTTYLDCCNAYELFVPLGCKSGTETYSRTEVVPKSETDAAVCRRLLPDETKAQFKSRRNVFNAEFDRT
ncbi:MAG TPA: hypothetical protein VHU41_20745 [Thermoanaerobaculia bacterium]|jgi:hypothetical protein|nr:hypothetical protein [Thermoanaerobaculia bacterium]